MIDSKGDGTMGCQLSGECAFFEQESMRQLSGLSGLYRSRYCQTDHATCARHRVLEANGATRVPIDLRPSDHVVADELIKLAHV